MLYKVNQVSKLLGVSRVTIYNKIDKTLKNELKQFVKMKKGVKCIEEEGIKIIKDSLALQVDDKHLQYPLQEEQIGVIDNEFVIHENEEKKGTIKGTSKVDSKFTSKESEDYKELYIGSLKDQISSLKEELNTKNSQIERFQILLKQYQDKIPMLEAVNEAAATEEKQTSLIKKILFKKIF